jgi:N2-acetyl-L-2,4-diaminobutanoate deacetylase
VLGEMIRDLNAEDVNGRLIIIPVINTPAVFAACRVSPIDGVNMNRSFPGDFHGTTTQQISAFVNHVLFPLADVFLDLHSGGSSLDIIPSSVIEPVKDPDLNRRTVAAGKAFGASAMVIIDNRGEARTAMASAAAAGLIAVGTELGGGALSTLMRLIFAGQVSATYWPILVSWLKIWCQNTRLITNDTNC